MTPLISDDRPQGPEGCGSGVSRPENCESARVLRGLMLNSNSQASADSDCVVVAKLLSRNGSLADRVGGWISSEQFDAHWSRIVWHLSRPS